LVAERRTLSDAVLWWVRLGFRGSEAFEPGRARRTL